MERGGGSVASSSCYYAVLGIRKDASSSEIRSAYRQLAMRWHPDKWTRDPHVAGEAKRRFQLIQEAYSVLSDQSKRSMYDTGLYDPLEEEDEDFCDFMQEMISMMNKVKEDEGDSFEDLQRMFQEMVDGDGNGVGFDLSVESTAAAAGPKKMTAPRRTAGLKKMTAPRRTAGPKKMTAPRRTTSRISLSSLPNNIQGTSC